MGSKLVRAVRNFNVENRAQRILEREKPSPAPMYPAANKTLQAVISQHPDIQDKIHNKDEKLLSLLKEVYVDSTDPSSEVKDELQASEQGEFRLPNQILKNMASGIDVDKIQKGNISFIEALTVLHNYKLSPKTWTKERIAKEYSLNMKDTQSMLEYFKPFDITIIPPKDKKQITEE
ncbi:NADH dehydrogenase [ubiquinone] 1 alpha subcomplex assembly factor 4 [Pseudophryne corroboree]|uniref:NADH dehydrogenase [ubiquinone] 1 alpha subcomplex assembly factor 4 n=1 Tax=Pseudophryne corroboree TaxID=495146 RepID=UPI0030817210